MANASVPTPVSVAPKQPQLLGSQQKRTSSTPGLLASSGSVLLQVEVARLFNSAVVTPTCKVTIGAKRFCTPPGKDVTKELDPDVRGLPSDLMSVEEDIKAEVAGVGGDARSREMSVNPAAYGSFLKAPESQEVRKRGRAGSERLHDCVIQWSHALLSNLDESTTVVVSLEESQSPMGSALVSLSAESSWGLQWHELKFRDQLVGEILIGVFPTVAPTSRIHEVGPEKDGGNNARFWQLKKKKAEQSVQAARDLCKKFVEAHITPRNDTGGKTYAKDLMGLLEQLKSDVGRTYVQEALIPSGNSTVELSFEGYQNLADLVKVVLREANNKGDYRCCKSFLDISYQYYCVKTSLTGVDVHTFLYSKVKQHEVFRNLTFWESVFLDVYTEQRNSQTEQDTHVETSTVSRKRTTAEVAGQEHALVQQLLLVFGIAMVNAKTRVGTIIFFVEKMARLYHLDPPEDVINLLKEIVVILHSPLRQDVTALSKASIKATMSGPDGSLKSTRLSTAMALPSNQLPAPIDVSGGDAQDIQPKRPSMLRAHSSSWAGRIGHPEDRGSWTKYTTLHKAVFYHNRDTNECTVVPPEEFASDAKEEMAGRTDKQSQQNIKKSVEPESVFGEIKVAKLADVDLIIHGSNRAVKGNLFLSNYRVSFMAYDSGFNKNRWNRVSSECSVHSISRVELLQNVLVLHSRDQRTIRVNVGDKANEAARFVDEHLLKLAFPPSQERTFAFLFKNPVAAEFDGWNVYNVEQEFRRQGVLGDATNDYWRITNINHDFSFASTYPQQLVVPSDFTDSDLLAMKKFRSKGRVPALVYRYAKTNAVMLRCAQPMTGLTGKRCAEDEKLLHLSRVKAILDSRPKANAVANQAKGGGYENVACYPQTEIKFMGIENIHVMRESLAKLQHVCATTTANTHDFLTQVESTHWLQHISCTLVASLYTAKLMEAYKSCCVHCSDGWDRTSQCCSLTQLLLDPFYRTLRGFCILIEKEWVSFGHKFADRCGHCDKNYNNHERSPIFLQFLDATWQLLQQFPCSFEFTESLLTFLADHVYKCKFGTFLFNNMQQREKAGVRQNTVSIWTHVLASREFVNAFFRPRFKPLAVNCDPRVLKVWPYYFRQDETVRQKEDLAEVAASMMTLERDSNFVRNEWVQNTLERQESFYASQLQEYATENDKLREILRQHGLSEHIPPSSPVLGAAQAREQTAFSNIPPPPIPAPPPPTSTEQKGLSSGSPHGSFKKPSMVQLPSLSAGLGARGSLLQQPSQHSLPLSLASPGGDYDDDLLTENPLFNTFADWETAPAPQTSRLSRVSMLDDDDVPDDEEAPTPFTRVATVSQIKIEPSALPPAPPPPPAANL